MSTTTSQPGEHSDALREVLTVLVSGVAPQRRAQPAGVAGQLDDRSRALAGLGALLAVGGSAIAYQRCVTDALRTGLSPEQIVDVLLELASTIGLARLVPAAVELASALGYDIDRALEWPDDTLR